MKYPKVTQLKSGEVYVSFDLNGKRKRIFSGKKYGINLMPNEYPVEKRVEVGNLLAYELNNKLKTSSIHCSNLGQDNSAKYEYSHSEALKIALRDKLAMGHSNIKVTLTYLRGLGTPVLTKEDMPQLPVLPAPEPPEPPEL